VNNVLGFPFIFRGALDVHARAINDEMKLAAAHALADLTREDVPDSVLQAYGLESLHFGPDYIIPKPFDPRVLLWEAPAVAKAAMETGVARKTIDIEEYKKELEGRLGKGWGLMRGIMDRAKASPKKIVFPEGENVKVLRAAAQVQSEGFGKPVLLGNREAIVGKIKTLGLKLDAEIHDPSTDPKKEKYAEVLYNKRQRKGVTRAKAHDLVQQPNYFASLMVDLGDADAMVSGLTYNYPDVIRPALQVVGTQKDVDKVAGLYIMLVKDRVYFFSDATVNIETTAEDLADIAILSARVAKELGIEPRVAMLSFSNFGSVRHPLSEKVKRAVEIVRKKAPGLLVDGEMQADTAVVEEIVTEHYPFSRVKDANVLVFPDLEAANVAYKLLQRLGGAEAIGPILMGMGKPVHVLQTGASVREIVYMAALAALDASMRK
jgi:malate dehydrogenase (oxaloacetate-decarboxylating)(NADP+)